MSKIRVLSQQMVQQVLSPKQTIATVEKVYRSKALENSTLWPMIFYEFEPGVADMDIKSGYMKELAIYGLKLVSWYGENPKKNLPALYGTTMLFDSETGQPIGLVDAGYITGVRTGAAGAIGSKWLAREDATTLLMAGTGHLALFEILSHMIAVPRIQKVIISSPRDSDSAENFATTCRKQLLNLVESSPLIDELPEIIEHIQTIEIVALPLKEAVPISEIIVTATPAKEPFIKKEWLQPGTHISCMGADMGGKQEIETAIIESARIFVDDLNQSMTVGELEIPIQSGKVQPEQLTEIGHLLLGQVAGRQSAEEITVFDSTGIALQDLAVTKQILDTAAEKNIGQVVEL
ncbi:alanine dehydrogenase [Enterococcus sp. DIV2402]|uniref:Alanine dehydrogenase n=1 Tax=Candidatus Enterococcus lowellii TaxID=2230877 RepID=A0ABZ2SLF1_9ENTE|nr:ornithine cyclodeaminase family protein [Enterococcus sp. DIV2402]